MSPLVSAPNRGYPDWQRVDSWDSGIEYSETGAVHAVGWNTPVIDVSRFGYLAMLLSINSGNGFYATITWYADSAGTVPLAARTVVVDSSIPNGMQARLPNMGPFVQVVFNLLFGGVTTTYRLWATNRFAPYEILPSQPLLVDEQNITLGSGVNATYYFVDYFSGPVSAWFSSSNAAWGMRIDSLSPSFTWDAIFSASLSQINYSVNFTVPPAPCRVSFANGGGGTTLYVAVTPSLTGAT